MKYTLAIADKIGVKVEGATQNAEGVKVPHSFILVCNRLPHDELRAITEDAASKLTANEFFEQHALGWRDQTLVLDGAGQAAPYSVEALKVLFSIAGMSAACWQAYMQQVMATAKN